METMLMQNFGAQTKSIIWYNFLKVDYFVAISNQTQTQSKSDLCFNYCSNQIIFKSISKTHVYTYTVGKMHFIPNGKVVRQFTHVLLTNPRARIGGGLFNDLVCIYSSLFI